METHENIIRLREKLGLSQETLAAMVGYKDRSSIAKVESGKVDLRQSKIAAFAKALNVTPAQLMGIDSTPANIAPVQPTPSPNLQLLSNALDQLNDEGQEKLVDYADDLVSSGKYKKHGADEVGRKGA